MTTVARTSRKAHVRLCLAASLLVATATLLTGCSSSQKKAASMSADAAPSDSRMTLDMIDGSSAYQHMSLVRGQKFTVRLPTHCGSHYGWRLAPESADNKFVSLHSRRSQQVEPGQSDMLDSPSCDEFTFVARRTGEVELNFIYDRPFMPDEQVRREFALSAAIDKPMKGQMMQHASVTVD